MPNHPIPVSENAEFATRRWLSNAFRSMHLVGVVLTAMAILGSSPHQRSAFLLTFATGVGLFGIELWRSRQHWREIAGAFVLLKLLLVLAMILMPGHAAGLFWFILISSSLVSHAPKSFRHRRLFG
jgi:hypothetical protein